MKSNLLKDIETIKEQFSYRESFVSKPQVPFAFQEANDDYEISGDDAGESGRRSQT